ncbi:phenylalanine-4-hydroxylase [Cyclobacterium lianum]|uniref:Phenylalanine-4-hydroxylase n=2 Tax=Cyclobacterium lianum TaxID=388280 RepID=A0A1M7Q6G1_9BACT|nr:phenylalanine-4-hydroxylase [Cyclobacterium lianum]SHN25943.1 phenylalanine-4-hydroxylase [Cyclobacterium lianum]
MARKPDDVLSDPRLDPLKQEYGSYSQEDFEVWKILFERQYKILPGAASEKFLEGLQTIGFSAEGIANFEEANKRLADITGWAIHVVPGLIDDDLFFGLLYHKRFPASTWLRKKESLDYLEEPDMFHDAFAHLPLLTDPDYTRFLKELAGIALKFIDNPLAIDLLSRVYWYTIEFGLIRERGALRIYGAGILSSAGETKYCLSEEPQQLPYDVEMVMNTPFWKNKFQDRYFVIDDFEMLYASVPSIERNLVDLLEKGE